VALFVCAGIAQANWIKSFSNNYSVVGSSIIQTSDGGFIACGSLPLNTAPEEGALLLKMDNAGNFQWAKRYGDGNNYNFYTVMEVTGQEYIAAGLLSGVVSNGLIVKTDSSGNILWQKEYPGISAIRDIKQTSDGGYIASGYYLVGHPDPQYYVALKLDSDLNPIWRTEIPIYSRYDKAYPIYETNDAGFIFSDSARIVKLSFEGDILWQKRYQPDNNLSLIGHIFSVYPTSDNQFIVCGQILENTPGVFVMKIDMEGNVLWTKSYNQDGYNEWAFSIIEASNGDFIVGGQNLYTGSPRYIWLLRIDDAGNILWQKEYGNGDGSLWTDLTSPIIEINESIFAIGSRRPDSNDPFKNDLLLLNLNKTGHTGNDCDFITDTFIDPKDISVTAYDTTVEPDRTLYAPLDVNVPVYDTNLATTVICEGLPAIAPTIAQTPMSGPPGTTFTQWGTGFTPNSTGKLYTRNPDLSEHYIQDIDIDETGHFDEITYESPIDKEPGTYTWWVVDGPTEIKSNEVSYEITDPQATQVMLTVSIDPQEAQKTNQILSVSALGKSTPGIKCGNKCEKNYNIDTEVKLEEIPQKSGWKFDYWDDGMSCDYQNPTTVVMDSDRHITARLIEYDSCDKQYYDNKPITCNCVVWVKKCKAQWLDDDQYGGMITLDGKKSKRNSYDAEPGSVAVIIVKGKYAKNGHVAYVKYVFGSKITIEEANYKTCRITTRTGTEEELNIIGYIKQ